MANITAHRVFDALGDPTRRAVFERLHVRRRSVAEIAAALPISRPAVSQHLRVLKEAGLVVMRSEGTRRYYAPNPAALDALRTYLDQFWDRALVAFAAEAERVAKADRAAKEAR